MQSGRVVWWYSVHRNTSPCFVGHFERVFLRWGNDRGIQRKDHTHLPHWGKKGECGWVTRELGPTFYPTWEVLSQHFVPILIQLFCVCCIRLGCWRWTCSRYIASCWRTKRHPLIYESHSTIHDQHSRWTRGHVDGVPSPRQSKRYA